MQYTVYIHIYLRFSFLFGINETSVENNLELITKPTMKTLQSVCAWWRGHLSLMNKIQLIPLDSSPSNRKEWIQTVHISFQFKKRSDRKCFLFWCFLKIVLALRFCYNYTDSYRQLQTATCWFSDKQPLNYSLPSYRSERTTFRSKPVYIWL